MENKEYKYTTKLEYEVTASAGAVDTYISNASLQNLKPLIPESVDFNKNIDLLGVAFNAAVVNRFNKNGDGIDSSTAVEISDYFIHKPTNVEHNRDQVVGHIVSSGFSSFEDSSILNKEQVLQTKDPVNISLAAVVYKTGNSALAEMLEEGEDFETTISTSWELGFNDYAIAVGSRDLNACEIFYGEEAESYKENLIAFGGNGKMEDGRPCFRLVVGEVFPLGVAFTTKPAAEVSGVFVKKDEKIIAKKDESSIIENKSSQSEKINVFEDKEYIITNMETEKLINSLEALLNEKRRENDFSEEAVASISKLVNDVIIEKSAEWQSKIDEAETQKQQIEEAQADMSQKYNDISEELKVAQEKLTLLEEEKSERQSAEAFNGRMEALSSEFSLTDEDLEVIASEVSQIELDEQAFAAYKEKFEKVWAHKNKDFIKAEEEKFQAKIEEEVQKRLSSQASEESQPEEVVEAALENVEEQAESIPNNNAESAEGEESLSEKFAKAFSSDNISIKY